MGVVIVGPFQRSGEGQDGMEDQSLEQRVDELTKRMLEAAERIKRIVEILG